MQGTNESRRLLAVDRLELRQARYPTLDRITNVARQLFDVPIALVSIIDSDNQWFKGRSGLEIDGTPREHSICDYTIQHDSVFVVPDAAADRRFARNPLITGAPNIRFYAGAPLVMWRDVRVGSLCIIDHQPRDFLPDDMKRLAALAQVVAGELWLGAIEADARLMETPHTGRFDVDIELTGAQVRAARALLSWSINKLASEAKISPTTLQRIEKNSGRTETRASTTKNLRHVLEEEGIIFVGGASNSPGVRLKLGVVRH